MSDSIRVHAIGFDPDGATFTYTTDQDFKGATTQVHQLTLSLTHPDYAEDITHLSSSAVRAVRNALEDHHNSEPVSPDDVDSDDEPDGMGMS